MYSPNNTRRATLLASVATSIALGMAAAAPGFAQDNDNDDDEETDIIVVTGFRAAIESAIQEKRTSTSIVEAVSAEDIGKLPDVSIAESLARLPGLAAQRLRGRAQVLSVRGLGPDYTTALLNGREQVTAGDNRGVEFDQYPSELISKGVVYKTPDAALIGQGLAGTVDLQTVKPLAYGEEVLSLSARYEWNDAGALNAGSEDDGYRLTGVYIDQFRDDTIGVALGIATQSTPTQATRWDAWGYPTTGAGELVLGGAKPYVESRELNRDAFFGTVEFQPDGVISTSIDAFYTQFEDVGVLRGIELPLWWSGAQLQPGYGVTNNLVSSGTFNGVQGVVRNDARGREATLFSAGWNTKITPNDSWTFETDLSFSGVDRDDYDLETYTGTGQGFGNGASDNLGFSLTGNNTFVFNPTLDYADPSLMLLTDPQGWGQAGFIKRPSTEDTLTSLRLSAERSFDDGPIASVEAGVNISAREKSKRSDEAFLRLTGTAPVPSDLIIGSTSLDFIGIPGMISYDPFAVLDAGIYTVDPNLNPDVITKAWDVSEDVTTFYAMANLDAELADRPLTGNLGVQIVHTDQSSDGASVVGGTVEQFTAGAEYTEVLPSANFSWEFMDNQFLRLGVARTLARARMDQLRASQELGLNLPVCAGSLPTDIPRGQACFNASGGNPTLRPYIADSLDFSYEWYFATGGAFSAAAYYKDISNWIDGNSRVELDFSGLVNAVVPPALIGANPEINRGILSGPDNTEGGWIQGLEFRLTLPFDAFIEGPLSGFGLDASLSVVDSEVKLAAGADPISIPGLSETISNITVFYEYEGFEARVSNRYRSDFLGEVIGFGAGLETRNVQEESVVDAQIGYEFADGSALEGVQVVLQANNITDERFETLLNDDPMQVKDYQEYGTTYLLGVRYRR